MTDDPDSTIERIVQIYAKNCETLIGPFPGDLRDAISLTLASGTSLEKAFLGSILVDCLRAKSYKPFDARRELLRTN
jgi:hypothetical protein